MTNQGVARILERIADLLEIRGGETYRVRAYRKAATVIESRAESLAELLYVPGLGPKTVRRLYEKLGIASVDELRQAAGEHRISREPSLGPEIEQTVLKGLELYEHQSVRLSLGVALPLAEDVVERLKQCPHVGRICPAGSLRRRKETIGDLDIVVETDDPQTVGRAFTRLPLVAQVIETGPSMTSVWSRRGLRMDLRFSDTEHFGAMLHHCTGGKLHNIRLRGVARGCCSLLQLALPLLDSPFNGE